MIIKEGSKIKLIEGNDNKSSLIDEIIVNEDIEIKKDGNGYAILLRTEGYDNNSLFESDRIEKDNEDNYIVYGYFKDALLIVKEENRNMTMFESWMEYDS